MPSAAKIIRQKGYNLFKPAVVNVQNNYLDEQCIIVDENDKPLRSGSKRYCHSVETLSLHRAFSIFLFTKNRELILQRRAAQKITFPLVWTNACCSHPLWNENEMSTDENNVGIRRAAKRKLSHELGIHAVDIGRMKVMGRFLYKSLYNDKWGEHEMDYAIILPDFDKELIKLNPEEVDAVAVVSTVEELNQMIKSNESSFSPWFNLLMQGNFLQKWWKNLDSLDELSDSQHIHRLS